jgi:hypothetical protein
LDHYNAERRAMLADNRGGCNARTSAQAEQQVPKRSDEYPARARTASRDFSIVRANSV